MLCILSRCLRPLVTGSPTIWPWLCSADRQWHYVRNAVALLLPLRRPSPQVDLVDDVIESEASRKTARVSVLLAAAFAVALLGGIFFLTWSIVGRLHAHVDRLSEHVNALSVRSADFSSLMPALLASFCTSGASELCVCCLRVVAVSQCAG